MPIVGIGELLWDLPPAAPRLLGGAPANFAVLSARLGNSAALVSRLGADDLGTHALAQLHEIVAGTLFESRYIQTSARLPTGTVPVTRDAAGKNCYTIAAPVAWDEIELSPGLLELAANASAVCFGTLAQRAAVSRAAIRRFVEATAPACLRVCDVNLRAPFYNAETVLWGLRHATVLKVSDEELPALTNVLSEAGHLAAAIPPAPADADALGDWSVNAAQTLLQLAPQCRLVAITLGPHGSLLADRSGTARHPGFPTTVADTIGAGDAFTAGLVHAYRHDTSLEHIGAVANLCGSFVASQRGATPEFPGELLDQIQDTLV